MSTAPEPPMEPTAAPVPGPPGEPPTAPADKPARWRWYHKAWALLAAIFCFEVGVFLAVFPWLDYWDWNYFSLLDPDWRDVWVSNYFRGAISGVGLVNVYISFTEVFRLRRFASAGDAEPEDSGRIES